jgi:hypothetical protein
MKGFIKKKDKLMFNTSHATHETSRFEIPTYNVELSAAQRITAIRL